MPAKGSARVEDPAKTRRRGLSPSRLERVQARVGNGLAEALTIEQLAADVGLSQFHFARMFKVSTGLAPHAYITRLRVDRAKVLLEQADIPIVEVGRQVGYQTQSHFTTVFHRVVGTTPLAFRRLMQAELRHGKAPL